MPRLRLASASTDRHGRFEARHLPAGRYIALASPYQAELGWARPVDFEIADIETAGPIDINWLPCPSVSLVVTGADGSPVSGNVTVNSLPQGDGLEAPARGLSRYCSATLDENGSAVLRVLAPGRARIYIRLVGAPRRVATVVVDVEAEDNEPIRITLPD